MPHQNNVAMSIPTPMQSTNITQKRNLMNATMVRRRTNAKPIDDTESETGTVLILGLFTVLHCITILTKSIKPLHIGESGV